MPVAVDEQDDRIQNGRHSKKVKLAPAEDHDRRYEHVVPVHPFGVQPSGNLLLKDGGELRRYHQTLKESMGHFSRLPDAVLIDIVSRLDPVEIVKLGATSRAMLAYTSHESIWKEAMLRIFDRKLKRWSGTWKSTTVSHLSDLAVSQSCTLPSSSSLLYSDELYLPLQLASLPLQRYEPKEFYSACRGIERVGMSSLSKQDFFERYAKRNKPCLLTTEGSHRKEIPTWCIEDVRRLYAGRRIRAEALTMSIDTYAAYARTCAEWEQERTGWVSDESPFYLFDPILARTMQADGRFAVPPIFREDGGAKGLMSSDWDLFGLLKDRRPDNAWIIAGPRRSGSGWHVDPNRTSAYNTVLSGRKLWMLLPPHVTPPGVFISQDAGTITAPLSIAEWLTDFWQPCVRQHGTARGGDDTLLVDVCRPGETIYVPAGWKHLVVNLDESVAFTQNFVSPAELPAVLDFLRNSPDQISGFRMRRETVHRTEDDESDPEFDELPDGGIEEKGKLFDLFVKRLHAFDVKLCAEGLQGMEEQEKERARILSNTSHQPVTTRTGTHRHDQRGEGGWWNTLKKHGEAQLQSTFALPLDDSEELEEVPW